MNTTFRILDALKQGAPKAAIISSIAEAGIKCVSHLSDEGDFSFADVYMMDEMGVMPPFTYIYDLKPLKKGDIEYLLNGGKISFTTNIQTDEVWENYRSN